jgi:LytR cell envelope-related transcriptional attenuator
MNVNIRTPITLVLLISVLVIGLLVGWRLATADAPSLRESTSSSEATCENQQLEAGSTLRAGQVTVNVLNAGTTPNLAGDTMRALTRRGFEGGTTGNAPDGVSTKRVLILDPSPDSSQVRLVAKQFGRGIDIKKPSGDDDPLAVDIIVGNDFRASDLDDSAPTSMKVRGKTIVCVPEEPDADE